MRLEWHPLARVDIHELTAYIAGEDPVAAERVLNEIDTQTRILEQHPEIGRHGRMPGTRELVINRTPFIAVYQFKSDVLTILRVLHGARQWPSAESK